MSALRVQVLNTLTRRHAVKVVSAVGVEECCLAIGDVVGHESVLSAARMNSAMVVFLDSVDKANELVENGIVINGEFVPVLPLSTPAKKVTLSNVPPFISNEILTQALSRYGKLVSPIKMMSINSESPLLKHIVSFRRFVYMIFHDDEELDVTLSFRVDGFDYAIYVTTAKFKCFGCGQPGHLLCNCPDKTVEKEVETVVNENVNENVEDVTGVSEAVLTEAVLTVAVTDINPPAENETDAGSSSHQTPCTTQTDCKDVGANVQIIDDVSNDNNKSIENNQVCMEVNCETVGEEQTGFKIPLKRKKNNKTNAAKIVRKCEEQEDQDTVSDGESSDSSVTLSQSDFAGRSYDLDDIKLFLRSTKNKR
ncbi:hypothetical protein M9458_055572, partial [Cirrhinus mrigala]